MTEEKQNKEVSEKPTKTTRTPRTSENTVFIGQKPVMNYVVACLTCFNSGTKLLLKPEGEQSAEPSTRLSY